MRKSFYYILGGTLAFTLAGAASAVDTNSVTTTATTTILRPVTIHEDAALAFAKIVQPSSGTTTVSITTTGDTVGLSGGTGAIASGTASRGKYTVSGEGGQVVAVTVPANFDLTDSGSDTLTVALSSDAAGGTLTLSGSAGSAGTKVLNVGGSFSITSSTPTGAYSGQYTISVAYQ